MMHWSMTILGIAFVFVAIVYAVCNKQRRNLSRDRQKPTVEHFTLRKSLSPEKQGLETLDASPAPGYANTFPPHRRHTLGSLSAQSLRGLGEDAQALCRLPPDYRNLTPDKDVCDSADKLQHTTATGITVQEIQRLGPFPDYAALSGVPLPSEYATFNINTAMPRPYRPLRWAYHHTMSLTKVEPDWWLELDKFYVDRIKQRRKLFEQYGASCLQALPGSELATREIMEMCLQFLCARYPRHFTLDTENLIFHNHVLNNQTDLRITGPLQVLLLHVPEDFAIMIRDPETGIYSFRAGIIMSSLGWNLGAKIGLKLHEIHDPIPDYKVKMRLSMDRFFAKMSTDQPIQRGSWGVEIGQPLYMPPGDEHEALRLSQSPEHTIEDCHFRVDWQTLRRLPLSGAVVFNFKGLFTPLTEFRDEACIPTLLLKVLREGNRSIIEYKNTWHTEHVVIQALENYESEQIGSGLMKKDWEPHTLEESPFFPGWQEKWHRQQGF